MAEKVLFGEQDLKRILTRMAHEVVERNKGCDGLVFVGMLTRGVPLARRLAETIRNFEGVEISIGSLDISLYRDDLSRGGWREVKSTDINFDISQKKVVLVDDVLYTGRSVRAAMDALIDLGRPESIQLAVIVDRGHRELPIRPDYVGKNVPTSHREKVKVFLKETDGKDEIVLTEEEE